VGGGLSKVAAARSPARALASRQHCSATIEDGLLADTENDDKVSNVKAVSSENENLVS